jgi:hypothetical protein
MRVTTRPLASLLFLAFTATAPAGAQSQDLSIGVRVGTLGIGGEINKLLTDNIGVRVGANTFSYSTTRTESDVTYDAELKLKSFTALVDFFPSRRGAFHLTGGLVTEPAEVSGIGQPSGDSYDINGTTYTAAEVGTVTAAGAWPSTMPYAGLGWGTAANRGGGISLVFDLGVAIGKPTVTLNGSSAVPGSNLANDLAAEQVDLQKEIDRYFKVYPVISLGLVYRF